jgi:hypothetical protein
MRRLLLAMGVLGIAGASEAQYQERSLSLPGSNAQKPFHADPKMPPNNAPGGQDWRFSIPSYGGVADSCPARLQKEKELSALLRQKVAQLETELASLRLAKAGTAK